jgi:VanZ family protein
MAVIMAFSSATFSAEHTGGLLHAVLRWLAPWLTDAHVEAAHTLGRKTAHVLEYAVLAALWVRAFARGRGLPPRSSAWLALAISLTWALLDEAHQATLLSRTGSAGDVALDATGAVLALIVFRAGWRRSADRATAIALWLAAVGGAAALVLNAAAGVPSGVLWLTAPLAAAALVARHLLRRGG